MKFAEFDNAGGFRLEKVLVDLEKVECVEKPVSDEFGCIIVIQGQKYPVKQSYAKVVEMLQSM